MDKDPCREVVYLTVLCDHPYLVSSLFTVLLSLHLVTFLLFFSLLPYCIGGDKIPLGAVSLAWGCKIFAVEP